jgi:prohibitin 2
MGSVNPQNVAAAIVNLGRLAQVAVVGGLGLYGASHSLFNVEGGHRAVVFNRLVGIKDTVRACNGLAAVHALITASRRASWCGGVAATRLRLGSRASQVYEEGTHLMLPWFDRPIIYDVRAKPVNIQSTSGSKDLQTVCACGVGLR